MSWKSSSSSFSVVAFMSIAETTITVRTWPSSSSSGARIYERRSYRSFASIRSAREAARLREVRGVRRPHRTRSAPHAGRTPRDRSDRPDDEPEKTQTGTDQNPQRLYARDPGHRVMRQSHLHGDMQGSGIKRSAIPVRFVRSGHLRIRLRAKFLVG